MAKDKRSRSRKPSENKKDSASRSDSTATAVRVPLPSSSPSSESAPRSSSDHEGELQADSTADVGTSSQSLDTPQGQDASQDSEVRVLTGDGGFAPHQIEPGLGDVVEDSANDGAVKYAQSPAITDQSSSPDEHSYYLGAELDGASLDGSDEKLQTGEGDQPTSPSAAQPDKSSAMVEPQEASGADPGQRTSSEGIAGNLGPNKTKPGRAEDIQEERRKTLAAEKRVKTLEVELQRYQKEAERARKNFDREIQKANRVREADKIKLEEKLNKANNQNTKAEVAKYKSNVEKFSADLEAPGRTTTGDDAHGGVSGLKKQVAGATEELTQAAEAKINAPTAALPTSPKSDPRPGSARFLLAEYEYLLDKSTSVYHALRAMADYADGGGALPSAKDTELFDKFGLQLTDVNAFITKHLGHPEKCLLESRRDWSFAVGLWKSANGEEN
ncbi:hypothetical protein F5883DRAFT_636657 [Diaporthe sp. PMI_573]|nr:hypothetical protein F5883DRAFT_636657 [Diaporthaceae sp. PMI_573]